MRLVALANNRLEKRLQVPMGKAITLPLRIDGHDGPFAVYVTSSVFATVEPSDQDVLKVARAVADAINKGTER